MAFFRFLFVVVSIVIILTAAGAAVSTLPALVSGGNETKRFSDTGFGVSFFYSSDWKKEYISSSLVRFWNEKATMILEVEKMEKDKTHSLEEYTKENLREITESAESDGFTFVLEENKDTTLGGKSAHRIKALLGKEGTVAPAVQVWAIDNGIVYSLSFSSALNEYENTVQSFENVIQSFGIK